VARRSGWKERQLTVGRGDHRHPPENVEAKRRAASMTSSSVRSSRRTGWKAWSAGSP
jgi:hypothetical protein